MTVAGVLALSPAPKPPPMTLSVLVLALHALATFAMCGIVWFVQLVHYPLMHHVDREDTYFIKNARQTGWVVVPLMLVEIFTGFLLILNDVRPEYIPSWVTGLGMILIAAIWLITFYRQVPRHQILIQCRYNGKVVDALVRINWGRTVLWTLRAIGVAIFLFLGLTGAVAPEV